VPIPETEITVNERNADYASKWMALPFLMPRCVQHAFSGWRVIRPERAVATVAENRAYSVPRHFEARDFDISVMREAQAIRAVGGLKLPSRYQSLLLIAGDDRSIDLA